MVDSDWATDKVDWRSTSAGVALLGGCTILSYSRTQGSPALSSGLKQKGTLSEVVHARDFFICSVAKELNVDLKTGHLF